MRIQNACIDDMPVHQIRPFEVAGSTKKKQPKKVKLDSTKRFNQSLQSETKMACIVYSLTHTKHEQERVETLDPVIEREGALLHGASIKKGWSMNGGLIYYKGKYYISAYANADKNLQKIKDAINQSCPIFTGSNSIDWKATRKNKKRIAQIVKNSPGHAVCLNGYDDDFEDDTGRLGAFCFKNSYDDFPEFRVMYDDVKYLYSTIVLIIDPGLAENLKRVQNAKLIQEAADKGITNGKNLTSLCKRYELVIMIGRALYGVGLSDQEYLDRTEADGIRNGERRIEFTVRYEAMLMVARMALIRSGKDIKLNDKELLEYLVNSGISNAGRKTEYATREEAVLLVARGVK